MKLQPNMFLHNVSDMARARAFYESIFDLQIAHETPGFAAYPIGAGILLALQSDYTEPAPGSRPNTELVMNMNMARADVDALYAAWLAKGAREIEAPHEEIFGYTFVVADPDGNLIRYAPVDE